MTYFDIESILAEEELVPCTTLFDFSHLGHLDDSSSSSASASASGTARTSPAESQYLKEETKLKMPLWAMEKWSSLRYVKVHLPRHLNQKARERWEADPVAVDLRCVHHWCHASRHSWMSSADCIIYFTSTPYHHPRPHNHAPCSGSGNKIPIFSAPPIASFPFSNNNTRNNHRLRLTTTTTLVSWHSDASCSKRTRVHVSRQLSIGVGAVRRPTMGRRPILSITRTH